MNTNLKIDWDKVSEEKQHLEANAVLDGYRKKDWRFVLSDLQIDLRTRGLYISLDQCEKLLVELIDEGKILLTPGNLYQVL